MIRPTRSDLDVLVAMVTRDKPLVRHRERSGWFVPEWLHPSVGTRAVKRLEAAGLLAPDPDRPRLRLLTGAGRDAALNLCTDATRKALSP